MPHISCYKFGKQKQKKIFIRRKIAAKRISLNMKHIHRRRTSIFSTVVIFDYTYNLRTQKHKPSSYNSPCPHQVENYDEALDATLYWSNFFLRLDSPSGSMPPQYRSFTITLTHTTVGRTPLNE